jgi:hypothetical protein
MVEAEDGGSVAEIDPDRAVLAEQSQRFWTEFIDDYLKLDDPEQPKPRPARLGYISLSLPAPVSWLTAYRGFRPDRVGIFLSCRRNTAGAYARQAIIDEWKAGGAVKDELGGTVRLDKTALGSVDTIIDSLQVESLEQLEERKKAFSWLAERVNTFVNGASPPDLSRGSSGGYRGLARSRAGTISDALWLSMYGPPMNDNAIYIRIVARTRQGLGQAINPHLFRDCAATSIAIDDPAHVGIASRLLGHRTRSTTERYYNQARSVEASRLMQKSLLARRNGVVGAPDPMNTIR